jgi:NitT/TauT family transport system substrate-binding protein
MLHALCPVRLPGRRLTVTPRRHPPDLCRRRLLQACLGLPLAGLSGCSRPLPPVRVAGIVWVGYEPLFLARELGHYNQSRLRLVESPSNTASLMSLATGDVEAASLTLDEFLTAREGGLDVRVILVFDESAGADVVMARPQIRALTDLRGKRIGVEHTAVGALMLAKLLEAAGLAADEVVKVALTSERHLAAYRAGEIDAVVSFEPYATQLAQAGAHRLLDSSAFPGLIVDVLAARSEALQAAPDQFRQLCAGYFRALAHLKHDPTEASKLMAQRMGIQSAEVLEALEGVRMLDLADNHAWLNAPRPRLLEVARSLADLMLTNRLLMRRPKLDGLIDARHLPPIGRSETA